MTTAFIEEVFPGQYPDSIDRARARFEAHDELALEQSLFFQRSKATSRVGSGYSLVSLKSPLTLPRVHVPVSVRLNEPMFSSFPSMMTFTGFPRSSLESASR